MASFHFRKIDRALDEFVREINEMDDSLLDMQFRYFNLLERLRSTEVKIHKFDVNYVFTDNPNCDPIIHGLAFSDHSWTKSIHKKHKEEAAAFRQAAAFSPLAVRSENCECGLKQETGKEIKKRWKRASSAIFGLKIYFLELFF